MIIEDKKSQKQRNEFTNGFVQLAKVFVLLATPAWYLTSNYNQITETEVDTPVRELIKENITSMVDMEFVSPVAEPAGDYKTSQNPFENDIQQQVVDASVNSDIDSHYLLLLATIESTLNTNAKASKGTASGLYQFVEQTWLEAIRKHGGEYGLENEAKIIKKGVKGNPHLLYVEDKAEEQRILDMRYDPTIATYMAIDFTKRNKQFLENVLKEEATPTNLYTLHFLGKRNASKFFKVLRKKPNWNPVDYFSKSAVNRNKGIFYFADGETARSFGQVHDYFQAKIDKAEKTINPEFKPRQAIAYNDFKS